MEDEFIGPTRERKQSLLVRLPRHVFSHILLVDIKTKIKWSMRLTMATNT